MNTYFIAFVALSAAGIVWWINLKLTRQIRASEESAKKAYDDVLKTAAASQKIQGEHEKTLSEIHSGVSDDRASSLLSSGPND